MITWMIKKISRQTRMMDRFFLVRNQIAFAIQIVQCVHVFQTLKNGFSNRAYGIMVSPLFLFAFFFVSGGTITNDLSTARNRSIIWRHCLCIGNGSGNIARNTNTGIGLIYIYVIFLTMPSLCRKKDDYERKRIHFLTLLCVKNVLLWFMFDLEVHH